MSEGFVPRARNPLKQPKPLDPIPNLVVVLDGGTPAAEDTKPPGAPVRYTIIGESFEAPLLPVVVGSKVEFRNDGRNSPRLYSPTQEGLVPGDPISPKGRRDTIELTPVGKTFEIRDRESAHFSGRLVTFPHRYFSTVKPDGSYEIPQVAPGQWKVRLWYRDGWIEMPSVDITVTAKRTTKVPTIEVPGRINIRDAK